MSDKLVPFLKDQLKVVYEAVVGSRDFQNLDLVRVYVNKMAYTRILVSGNAYGVDMVAQKAAGDRGMFYVSIPVSDRCWDYRGKKAGHQRNEIIEFFSGEVTCFWSQIKPMGGGRSGSLECVKLFLNNNKTVRLFGADGKPLDAAEVTKNPEAFCVS